MHLHIQNICLTVGSPLEMESTLEIIFSPNFKIKTTSSVSAR